MEATLIQKEKLFFQIYRNLEKELLEMTDYIHFSEENLESFSINLATFILRCSVESESIMKELFKKTELYASRVEQGLNRDKVFWQLRTNISNMYKLPSKKILIYSDTFYFSGKYSREFCPFNYKNSDGENIPTIYNSLKHDRANNLHKATLEAAINSLGALFILNHYYNIEHEESSIFMARKAFIEPIVLAGYNLDKLPKEEVNKYLDECLTFEWFRIPNLEKNDEFIDDIRERFNHLETHHKEAMNKSLEELTEVRRYYKGLFDCFSDPFSYPSFETLPNVGETVDTIKEKLKVLIG